eukprot:5974321-Pyramimonas_sp.AAC.1
MALSVRDVRDNLLALRAQLSAAVACAQVRHSQRLRRSDVVGRNSQPPSDCPQGSRFAKRKGVARRVCSSRGPRQVAAQ